MDPINQTGDGSQNAAPVNPSMPPNNIPQQPVANGVPETPEAPLETEVNQFQPAEPSAPAPQSAPSPQVSEPATEFNAVPAQSPQAPTPVENAPGASPANVASPPEPTTVAEESPAVTNESPDPSTPDVAMPTSSAPAEIPPSPAPEPPDQELVAPPPPPTVEQIGTLDQQPEMQNPAQTQPVSQFQTPPTPKKSKTGLIIVIILLVAVLGGGAYYYLAIMKGSIPFISNSSNSATDTAEPTVTAEAPTPEQASSTTGADVVAAYGKATAISATSDKAKVVDVVISPVLNKTFSNNIKLIDASTMLSYLTNRAITSTDVTSVKTQLEALGYKTADSTAKQLTMTKAGTTWVITFSVDTPTKAEIDVTY